VGLDGLHSRPGRAVAGYWDDWRCVWTRQTVQSRFAVFTVGSLLCAVSLNGLMLVIFRLVQGAGAALLFANSAAILTECVST